MQIKRTREADYQRTVKLHVFKGQRYIIVDPTTGTVIDDAQGHGFRSQSNAEAYADAKGWVVLNREVVECNQLF